MNKKDHGLYGWLTADMLLFVVVNVFLITKISAENRFAVLENLNFLKLVVLGLAAYRAANIVSNEVVTAPIRAPFVDEAIDHGRIVETPKKRGFAGMVGQLIYCPSCSGVWLATILTYCYIFWPQQTFIVALFLALSGLERIVARILGWFAIK